MFTDIPRFGENPEIDPVLLDCISSYFGGKTKIVWRHKTFETWNYQTYNSLSHSISIYIYVYLYISIYKVNLNEINIYIITLWSRNKEPESEISSQTRVRAETETSTDENSWRSQNDKFLSTPAIRPTPLSKRSWYEIFLPTPAIRPPPLGLPINEQWIKGFPSMGIPKLWTLGNPAQITSS